MKMFFKAILASLILTTAVYANPTVNSPASDAYVTSPFTLSASSATCSSQSVSAMAYSLDSGADIVTVNAQVLNAQVSAGTGAHTVHVKAWGNQGDSCVTDVAVTVTGTSGNPAVSSPANGATVGSPFTLAASSSSCYSQPVSAMAYSIDGGGDIATVNAQSLNTEVSASTGAHTLHVKSWGNQGSSCSTAVSVNVGSSSSSGDSINVSSPYSNESVTSPFTLSATASTCSSQSVSAMAYSLDSGSNILTVNSQSLDARVMSGTGAHTLHVKSWGNQGAGCAVDIVVNVSSSSGTGPYIPSNAISVSNIQTLQSWKDVDDASAGGTANGATSLVSSPSYTGTTRQTVTNYTYSGAERYNVVFGDDTQATNFVYDAWVYLANTGGTLANLEMDMNQVMPNGQTVIFGFQCDGYNKTWDYTVNAGTPDNPVDKWVKSNAGCDIHNWSQWTWHHIQIAYSRNDSGVVTYKAVYLDGVMSSINATVPSAFALGWSPTLLTNFQVDGLGSKGQIIADVDDITVYRW